MYCENCGADTKGEKFCSNCGATTVTKKTRKAPAKTVDALAETSISNVAEPSSKPSPNKFQSSQTAHIKQNNIGLIVSYVLIGVMFLSGLIYVSATEARIRSLEDQISYMNSSISDLEFSLSNTEEWAYGEIDSLVSCVNDYFDAVDFRGFSWFPCIPPTSP